MAGRPTRAGRLGVGKQTKEDGAAFFSSRRPPALLFCPLLTRSSSPTPTGPDRKLYLPGGLLDPSEVPAYLNGTLPGE